MNQPRLFSQIVFLGKRVIHRFKWDPKTERIRCFLCGSPDYRKVMRKKALNIVRCRRCGLVYVNPRLTEEYLFLRYSEAYFYNEYLATFQADRNGYDMQRVRDCYDLYLRLLDTVSGGEKRLLDVGCGGGFFLKAVEERGWRGQGVEVSDVAARYARDVVGVDVRRGRLENTRFPLESFDVVVLLDVLEHLVDPLQALKDCRSYLKAQGLLILNTPDFSSLSRRFLGKNWAVLSPVEHLYYFTEETLTRLLGEAGFFSPRIYNLLQLNPDYTHKPRGLRYRHFQRKYKTWLKEPWYPELHSYSREAVIGALGDVAPIAPKTTHMPPCFRGDTLIAVASKE